MHQAVSYINGYRHVTCPGDIKREAFGAEGDLSRHCHFCRKEIAFTEYLDRYFMEDSYLPIIITITEHSVLL
jgi:hypothetical protein